MARNRYQMQAPSTKPDPPNQGNLRILHGTSAVSLQSTRYLADALQGLGHQTDVVVYRGNAVLIGHEDINLGVDLKRPFMIPFYAARVVAFAVRSMRRYDVFHFHFGRSLLPLNLDLWILKRMNKKVFMEYHGSDIRRKTVFQRNNPFAAYFPVETLRSEKRIRRLQHRVARHVDGIIVHDAELREHLYTGPCKVHVIPLRMRVSDLVAADDDRPDRIVISHAPTNAALKGTKYVTQAIENLSKTYDIEFHLVTGVPHEEAQEIYRTSDIIIDSLLAGTYGMLAIESMAYGIATVGYIREDLLHKFPAVPPIHSATVDNLEKRIEELIRNPQLRRELGIAGHAYVAKHHNSTLIAREIVDIYSS